MLGAFLFDPPNNSRRRVYAHFPSEKTDTYIYVYIYVFV